MANKYIKEWDEREEISVILDTVQDEPLREALMVAMEHRTRLDYDNLAKAYDLATTEVQELMVAIGVIIVVQS